MSFDRKLWYNRKQRKGAKDNDKKNDYCCGYAK